MNNMSMNKVTEDLLIVPSAADADVDAASASASASVLPRGSIYLEVSSFVDALSERCPERHGADLVVDFRTGGRMTVADLKTRAIKFAEIFSAHGLRRGEAVHTLLGSENAEVAPAALGAWAVGAVVSFGEEMMGAAALAHQLEQAEIKILLVHPDVLHLVSDTWKLLRETHAKEEPTILCVEKGKEEVEVLPLRHIGEELKKPPKKSDLPPVEVDVRKDVAAIFYTSGTTGRPKGVLHSHYTMFNFGGIYDRAKVAAAEQQAATTATTTMLSNMRMSTQHGFMEVQSSLYGNRMVVKNFGRDDDTFVRNFVSALRRYRPEQIRLNPGQLAALVGSPLASGLAAEEGVADLKGVLPIASTVPQAMEKKVLRTFSSARGLVVFNAYGASEFGLLTAGTSHRHLGWLKPGCAAKVVDEDGKRLPPGREGELRTRTPYRMLGYLKREEETEEYFDEEGFAKSGDLAKYDEDGRITIVGRIKDQIMIIHNGVAWYVAPTEMEGVVMGHPEVQDCIVWKDFDQGKGEVLRAGIVPIVGVDEPAEELAEDIRAYANEKLSGSSSSIQGRITFHRTLPRNKLGKLMRADFRRRLEQEEAGTS